MVSFEHQVVIELARDRGQLLREILPDGHKRKDGDLTSEITSADLSLVPTQYLADQITLFRDKRGRPCFAILVEVQRKKDDDKEWTWPLYLGVARWHHKQPVLLLVIALRKAADRWARALINKDLPSWGEPPVVISPQDIPIVDEPDQIRANPQLAVLSVMAHPSLRLAKIVLKTIRGCLDEERGRLYCEAVLRALSPRDRSALEAKMMKGIRFRTSFARKFLAQGRVEGRQEGKKEGRQEGKKEGKAEGMEKGLDKSRRALRRTALQLARLKLDRVSREERAALLAVQDTEVLSGLVIQLAKAKKPAQVKNALELAGRAARRAETAAKAA